MQRLLRHCLPRTSPFSSKFKATPIPPVLPETMSEWGRNAPRQCGRPSAQMVCRSDQCRPSLLGQPSRWWMRQAKKIVRPIGALKSSSCSDWPRPRGAISGRTLQGPAQCAGPSLMHSARGLRGLLPKLFRKPVKSQLVNQPQPYPSAVSARYSSISAYISSSRTRKSRRRSFSSGTL